MVDRNEEIFMDGFEVLDEFSNEELEVLVKLILDKGALTETLTGDEEYENISPTINSM